MNGHTPAETAQAKPYVWLASYPKSGNTWVRIFIHAYERLLQQRPDLFSLQNLNANSLASRPMFEWLTGIDSSILSPDASAVYRSRALTSPATLLLAAGPAVFKVHDRFRQLDETTSLVPEHCTRGVIYLVRNPLDITASWAYHRRADLQSTVDFMADEKAWISLSEHRQTFNLPQWLGSWTSHVKSWINLAPVPLLIIRYEDMLADAETSFRRLIEFIGLPVDESRLRDAIAMTEFSRLKKLEQETGFRELPKHSLIPTFFRQGKAGKGCQELPPGLQSQVVASHGSMMEKFDYL